MHFLKTVIAKTLNHSHSQPHIRPLWLSKVLDLITDFQISCRVDTNASCNILPLYKAKSIFGTDLKLGQPTMNLKGYINNDISFENLGSCCLYLYYGKQTYKVSCVADSKGYMILGRQQALLMEYVSCFGDPAASGQGQMETSIKTITDKPAKPSTEPVIPVVQKCTDKNIT